jgi:hypothetical protein
MDIESLLPNTYRKTADEAASFILTHPNYLEEIIRLSFSLNRVMAMRSSRVVLLIFNKNPALVQPFIPYILDQLCITQNSSSIRNLLHLFIDESENLDDIRFGKLIELCFKLLESSSSEIAQRALAMQVLYKISNKIPDIKGELKALIEINYEEGSPAFKSTAKNILKKLNSEIL